MCTPQSIIEKVGSLVFDEAVKAAIERGKYVIDYKTNLRELQVEIRKLEGRREIIRRKVREAEDDGKSVYTSVLDWLEGADMMTRDVHDQQLVGQTEADRMTPDVEEQLVGQTEVDGVIRDVQEQLVGQTEADRVTRDVQEQLVGQSSDTGNMSCFKWSCPNIKRRYQLSKEAKEKIAGVKKLIEESHFNENEISYPRPPPSELEFPSNENYVDLDSRTPVFQRIVDALKHPSVNVIGVHGLGGVGKTTLVEEVGKKMRLDGTFKQVALAVVSKDLNVQKIQSQLAESLDFKWDANSDDQKGRAKQLWDKFTNGERFLVILDDVWTKVDIKAIGIPLIKGLTTGCKVVLTSRNEDLLVNRMNVDKPFPIAELQELEAWTLFKKKVGDSIESQPELYSLAYEVCKKCKGLPIAINALGEALKGKPNYTWKNALDKLERYMITNIDGIDSSVCASIKLSYDMLWSSDAKSCFLLCCLFLEDAEISIDDLTRHCVARSLLSHNPRTLEEARNAVLREVDALKSASLLSNDDDENVVRIHDVIRDVGISIAREEEAFLVDHSALRWPPNPTNGPSYKVMSLSFKSIEELPDGLVYPQLETLMVDNSELLDLEVPEIFFNGMMQLKVLTFTRMRMRRLPSSLAKLTNLRMLYLNKCELDDIALLKDLKWNLEVLSLTGSSIEALPSEIGQLTSLRVLDLQDCDELMVIPRGVISDLTSLEELYFPKNFNKWEATTDEKQDTNNRENVSLEELKGLLSTGQLTTLHIYIPDVMRLPKEDLIFANLKGFKISVGSEFENSEEISGRCMLKLEGNQLRNDFIPLLDKVEVLVLKLESAVHPLRLFNKLTVLIIGHFKLKYLFSPTTVRGLVHLKVLEVTSCDIMEGIVGFEGQKDENEITGEVKFSKLKQLKLTNLPNLISFFAQKEEMGTIMGSFSTRAQPLFNEQVILPVLEVFEVDRLGNIVEIWDKQSPWFNENTVSCSKLREMKVQRCKKLMNLVPSNILPRLQNLQKLCVEGCPNIESIVFKNGKEEEAADHSSLIIPQLRYLRVSDMENLKTFYSSSTASNAHSLFNHQVILPVLEVFEVDRLGNIVEIWDKQSPWLNQNTVSSFKLRDMKVQQCKTLMNLVPSNILPRLQHLQNLCVEGCPNIESIFFENEKEEEAADDSALIIPQLRYLRISDMEKLKSFYSSSRASNAQSLFNHQVIFPVLERLIIDGLGNIIKIWEKQSIAGLEEQESFLQLTDLEVRSCSKLMHVFPSNMYPLLRNLKKLKVKYCETVKGIAKFEGEIDEDGLRNEVVSPTREHLEMVEVTKIQDKQPLLEPRKEVESLRKLVHIHIDKCDQLLYVFPSHMLPQNLQQLRIENCDKLEVIFSKDPKEEKEAINDDIIVFPRLKDVTLWSLHKLKSFYTETQGFFSHKVAFPVLETLHLWDLDKITRIWDNLPLLEREKEAQSFCQLTEISVVRCNQLEYVLPSYMLPQLKTVQQLIISRCRKIEVIISNNPKEKEATNNNDTIRFPQLKEVYLEDLPNLKSFICSETQLLFSNKVAFPILKSLSLHKLDKITRIWDNQPLSEPEKEAKSFCKLLMINVVGCDQLEYVLPFYMLPQLKNLYYLRIRDCWKMKVIISNNPKEKEATNNDDTIRFPQLKYVDLRDLPNLKSFISSETQLFFSNKDAFPVLEQITLYPLGTSEFLRNETSTKKECGTSGKKK